MADHDAGTASMVAPPSVAKIATTNPADIETERMSSGSTEGK